MHQRGLFVPPAVPPDQLRLRSRSGPPGVGPSRRVDVAAAERVADRVERLLAEVPTLRERSSDRRWLREVELLLPAAGDDARARLLQARAAVREPWASAGRRGAACGVQRDATEAAELFER